MKDLSPGLISYFFLEEDYPADLQAELDAVVRERVTERFESQFSFFDKAPVIGETFYDEETIREIADRRGKRSSFASEGLSLDAEILLEEYNDRAVGTADGTLTGETFVQMELDWIRERLDMERSYPLRIDLGDGFKIGYDGGRYAAIAGEPVDPEDIRELAEITGDEIDFHQVSEGEGSASPSHYRPARSFDSYLNIDHDLPYGTLTANQNGSRLKATTYDDQVPDVIDALR